MSLLVFPLARGLDAGAAWQINAVSIIGHVHAKAGRRVTFTRDLVCRLDRPSIRKWFALGILETPGVGIRQR
jgi:hypothetical protein